MTMKASGLPPETITRVRGQTPGLNGRIHFDNSGSALMPEPVIAALHRAIERDAAVGGYVAQEQQAAAMEGGYASLTKLLGGDVSDYAFVGSAVDGWTKAFYSLPLKSGDNIVTAYNEYCSNYIAYLQMKKNRGVEIRVARHAPTGGVDLEHLQALIDGRTALISISHMPSSSGEINPAEKVGEIARAAGVLYQLDACQSVGHVPVNVERIGCDIMTGTSRKFLRGPRGIGFLHVGKKARSVMEPVVLTNQSAEWTSASDYTLRQDARVFEAWERSVANQLGFSAAIDYLLELGVNEATAQIAQNAAYLRERIADMKNVKVECPANAASAIITFNVDGHTPSEVKNTLEQQNIAVQTASVVHTRLDLEERGITAAVRVSPHYYNDVGEMDTLLAALESL